MNTSDAAATLASRGVLQETEESVRLSSEFETELHNRVDAIEDQSQAWYETTIRESIEDETLAASLGALSEKDPRTFAEFAALQEYLPDASTQTLVTFLAVLRLFRPHPERTAGVPAPFIPVPGDHLPELTRSYSPSVAYVWLDDCDPCETVRAHLESLFPHPSRCFAFAVFGPDFQDVLAEEYDVTAGPAILFMRRGSVESRLYGAHTKDTIRTELELLVGTQ